MSGAAPSPDWIAVDWGTTRLRAWAVSGDAIAAEASSDRGMGTLTRDGFEPALLDLVRNWLGDGATQVVACGMVGSRQGWVEAPYVAVPCAPLAAIFARPATRDPRLSVYVIPGLRQSSPPDVMRGEETQIAGYLARNPGFDGVLCLPGTHTKWAQISAGEVVSFRTFMTGELFSLTSKQSVLRHSVGTGWDEAAFTEAVSDTIARPESIAARLFTIRADHLLNATSPDTARARLSGLLLGAELAAARPYWLGQRIALIGNEALSANYAAALATQGATAEIADGTACTLAGLAAARALIRETTR